MNSPRSKEDEDAGSMLMGFLSSLRKGYEEALSERDKEGDSRTTSLLSGHKRPAKNVPQASKRPRLPCARPTESVRRTNSTATDGVETSSGTTSYPAESSLEDSEESSGNEKGKGPSSEDSDKDSSEGCSSEKKVSSGERGSVPPRKRMKGKHSVGEFTRKNVAEHNHRMGAMRSQLDAAQQDSSNIGLHWPRDERADRDD